MTESPAPHDGTRLTREDMTTLPFTPRLQPPRLDGRRVSPQGVVTLPFAARVALGFQKGHVHYLSVKVRDGAVVITPAAARAADAVTGTPSGDVRLPADAHAALTQQARGHYDLEIFRGPGAVVLRPHGGA
jgi:hypothetical protein